MLLLCLLGTSSSLGGSRRLLFSHQRLFTARREAGVQISMAASAPTKLLYCKASRDGAQVGDCPFTHYARMAMEVGGVSYELKPTKNKPEWLGSMPCLAVSPDGAEAISESSVIAAKALPPSDIDEASLEATKSLFGAVAKYVKNTDPSADEELLQNVLVALESLEARLKDLGTVFLSGTDDQPGLSDCSVATKLYVLTVAGGHYKDFALPKDRYPLVHKYIQDLDQCDAFSTTKYPAEEMIFGWGEARGGGH